MSNRQITNCTNTNTLIYHNDTTFEYFNNGDVYGHLEHFRSLTMTMTVKLQKQWRSVPSTIDGRSHCKCLDGYTNNVNIISLQSILSHTGAKWRSHHPPINVIMIYIKTCS